MPPNDYKITATQPWSYVDELNQVKDGYKIWFEISKYGETHYVYSPSLNPTAVKPRIEKVVADRGSLG